MSAEELLLALKDILPPPQPEWWQIAPVWWLLLLVVLVMGFCFYGFNKRRQYNRLVYLARQELAQIRRQNIDRRLIALQLSEWLKRIALLAFPDRQVESMTGVCWLKFLDQCMDEKAFSIGPGQVFGGSIYSQNVEADSTEICFLCEQWLLAITPRLQQRGRA